MSKYGVGGGIVWDSDVYSELLEAHQKALVVDQFIIDYLRNKKHAPKDWDVAVQNWSELKTDKGAKYDTTVQIAAKEIQPFISWGTNPSQVVAINEEIPSPDNYTDESEKEAAI